MAAISAAVFSQRRTTDGFDIGFDSGDIETSSGSRPIEAKLVRLSARPADGNPVHAQSRLADPDRHALAILAAGADAGIEFEVVADHADAMQVARAVADQHRALDRRADLAVLQP